jgi:hypothetical protein
MTTPYTAKINGSLVNVIAGTLNVQNQIGQRSTGGLRVWSALGVNWQYGTQIQVYDEIGALAYNGFVVKDKITKRGARQGYGLIEHNLTIMDNCYKTDKRVIFASYLNQSAGSIVQSILGAVLASEGVTATANSIASGATITEVIWNGKQISAALTWLATQCGYWWNIDANNVLWFQPYGGITAPFVIDGTQIDAVQNLSVEYGNDMYVNKQYAKGAYAATGILTETFHGDSVKRGFTLSYGIASTAASDLSISVNSVAQTVGTKGDTGQQWYAAIGDAVLAQDVSQTVLGAGDTLSVTYKGRYPVLAVAQNPTLIAAQKTREGSGSGIVESVYANTKVHTLAAAFQIAGSLLSHYGSDSTVITFDTRVKGLQPGQMLTVSLSDFGLSNKQMLISSVAIDDQTDGFNIWFHVTAVGSPIESTQWQTYWQNLMNQSSDPSDLSDTADTALALLTSTLVTRTPVVTVTQAKRTGAVCGVSMLCGSWTVC